MTIAIRGSRKPVMLGIRNPEKRANAPIGATLGI